MKTIETKTNKNGQEMFYVDGKRVSKLTANAAESKNFDAITADVIGNTNVTVDNAKIRLDYALNGGITGTIFTAPLYFTSFENAIEAGKKIAAHFGEKLNAAYIGNITDDKIIATFYGGDTNPLINEIAKMPAIEDYAVSSEAQEIAIADEVTEKAATVENEIQAGTISICANAVGNGRVVIKVYGNHKCQPAKLDSVAAEMPRLSDIHIFASDQRNFNVKAKSYNGRYYAKANVYIFTNTSYGTDGFKKMYKFDTAKEAVRKLARQELDDKIITAEELKILLAADREIERQREAKLNAEHKARDAEWAKIYQAKHLAAKIALDSKSVNDNFRHCGYCAPQKPVQTALAESKCDDDTDVFDLLPTVDELNDVDTDAKVKADPLNALAPAEYVITEDAFIFATNCEIIARQRAELRAAIDNVPLPGKDVELWRERNEVAVEINKLYKIEELLTVDEFNAKLRILQEKLKDVDEQITACQNANKVENTITDDQRTIARQVCESLTAEAPKGWSVALTDAGNYKVTAHGLSAAVIDTITAGDFLNPKEFFAQFNRTQAAIDDEREAQLAEVRREREQLLKLRDAILDECPEETERLKLLDEMLAENDADLTALESLCTRPGMAKGNPKELWF